MKIAYIGSVYFSAKALEKLFSIKADVVGVITKEESNFNSDFYDLSHIAVDNNVPFLQTKNINSIETIDWIKALNPDVIFCFGWSNLIKNEILEIAPLGVIGFHPALLPFNKGRHPLIWAKILGLKQSGSTFFFMDEGADTGDILSQSEFEINFDDDAQVLYFRLIDTALVQIENFHFQLKNNEFSRLKQDSTQGNSWRKRGKNDGLIDFRMCSTNICNLVRALTKPYVGAHVEFNNIDYKVWKVEISNRIDLNNNDEPGKILNIVDNKIEVKTGDFAIWLLEHEINDILKIGQYLI